MSDELIDTLYVPPSELEPGYRYRWLNTRDQNVLNRKHQGWEIVRGPSENPLTQAQTAALTTGPNAPDARISAPDDTIRQRGDLVLARMPIDRWKDSVLRKIQQRRERQEATLDTMVLQSNENAQKKAKAAGLGRIPQSLVFAEENS